MKPSTHPLPHIDYVVGVTDTRRWSQFPAREGDIFVVTPAKCGTTWMQTIVTFLLFKSSDLPFVPAERSPWFDTTLIPIEDAIAALNLDEARNVIKTHTPMDGVPYYESAQYIGVYRDPRDSFMSWQNHAINMVSFEEETTKTVEQQFLDSIAAEYVPGQDDGLAGRVHHLSALWQLRHQPNVHLFHYSDMLEDLPREMRRVADAIGVSIDDELLLELANAASFKSMKSQHEKFVPGGKRGFWHDSQAFLNKGTSGQWREHISEATNARFLARLKELAGDAMGRWMIEGGAY